MFCKEQDVNVLLRAGCQCFVKSRMSMFCKEQDVNVL